MNLKLIPHTHFCKSGSFTFYKIEIPEFSSKKEAVFNFSDKFMGIKGVVNWVLRLGNGKNGEQYFIEYNRSFYNSSNVEMFESNGGSKGKEFCEAYLPIESLEFTKKCMDVFLEIKNKKCEVDKFMFLKIVGEVFNE